MIKRELQAVVEQKLFKGKVIVLTGPRQVGKTTLLKQVVEKQEQPVLSLNCDEPEVRALLGGANLQELRGLAGNYKIIVVDEAQRVKNIGLTLKLLADAFPSIQLLVTGSSSLELADEVNEPLTGRKFAYHLYPFSAKELAGATNTLVEKQSLEMRLIYGSYPDVVNFPDEAKECLLNLSDSYLYKDILALGDIRKPAQLEKLLVALALQLGREISYHELAQIIGATADTVERYIDLLEKCFVVFLQQAFSRNHRKEIKKGKKIYFYDNGIRNAIIQNFSPLNLRQDTGFLWENYFVAERMKANHYRRYFVKNYFWRTFQQQEIDLIEEADGLLTAFEIKWNEKRHPKIPVTFAGTYPQHVFHVVNSDNYMEYLL
ncbi:MAG: ATP-binding protein [Prevotellaceae bacterium]|jgi:predicted AAA+ superfamily ATPase|nr:ATP-binding protein [Prevotellaceae bacterium]